MIFRTEIEPIERRFQISTDSKIMTVGSCFSDVMGNHFLENKINSLVNPYGTVFNPASIFKLINHSLQNQPVFKHLFLHNNGYWNHYDFHSRFWSESKENLEQELNHTHQQVYKFLRSANYLIITLGTAVTYQLKENSQIVANCHKTPSTAFRKEILTVKDITVRFRTMYETLKKHSPKLKIILTVSPVRHTRDTLQVNSVSKSILRTSCYEIEKDFQDVFYFPSYEIMMDDLRDYRYYAPDLIHPNEQAEEYIFDKFAEAYFTDELKEFIKEWKKVKASLNHRPLHEGSEEHNKFLNHLLEKLSDINKKVDVSQEIHEVMAKLEVA